jgi:hypothetical protein
LLYIISNAGLKAGAGNKNPRPTGHNWESNLDPMGYYWSHCYKVRMGHTSKSFTKCLEGHKEGATHAKTMGGKDYNMDWKTRLC